MAILFSRVEPFVEGSMWKKNLGKYEFGPVVQMSFKDISYLELWLPFCSAERNDLCNFGRGYQLDQFCEIIMNLDRWFRCYLKDCSSGALTALLFSRTKRFVQFPKRASWGTFMW